VFSGLTKVVSDMAEGAKKAVGIDENKLTPPGVAPEAPGVTTTGGRRRRKTRKGKRSTRRTTRRKGARKAKKSRKH